MSDQPFYAPTRTTAPRQPRVVGWRWPITDIKAAGSSWAPAWGARAPKVLPQPRHLFFKRDMVTIEAGASRRRRTRAAGNG